MSQFNQKIILEDTRDMKKDQTTYCEKSTDKKTDIEIINDRQSCRFFQDVNIARDINEKNDCSNN